MSFGIKAMETFAYNYLENPYIIFLIIPIIILLFFIIRRDFVKMKEDADVIRKKKRLQWIMWVTRSIMALLIAPASSPVKSISLTILLARSATLVSSLKGTVTLEVPATKIKRFSAKVKIS